MSYTFIELEQRKTRIILPLFISIIAIYFVTAYAILVAAMNLFFSFSIMRFTLCGKLFLPSLEQTGIVLLVAFLIAVVHWSFSVYNLIPKLLKATGAAPVDEKDIYHKYFKNLVEEVSVAIGGRKIEAVVVPTVSMNAFALEDFEHRAVIGITEGLLSRLNRYQIEAVVAHEAGHIVSGDCLTTTVTCSLAELYAEVLEKLKSGFGGTRGSGGLAILMLYLIIGFTNFLSSVIRCFVSRQREYRADAIAVRLTREPLSLAEALKLISKNWRGAGGDGEYLESIYIVNPRANSFDEEEGFFADLFSTHPPIQSRVDVLLGMAHESSRVLEEKLKNFRRVSPVAQDEVKMSDLSVMKKWFVFMGQDWLGPFSVEELKNLEGFDPNNWARVEGIDKVLPAGDFQELKEMFQSEGKVGLHYICPCCRIDMEEISYEGAPVLKCKYCQGVFVGNDKISRILIREDKMFLAELVRLAEAILASKDKINYFKKDNPKNLWVLRCPKCNELMHREYFLYSYPVLVDRCASCLGVWFDKNELEILQYIWQRDEGLGI